MSATTIKTHFHMGSERRYCDGCRNELDDHTIAGGFCDNCGGVIEAHEADAAQRRINEDVRRDAE
jgi:rRNA maturation endonuclease Nob1